MEESSIWRPQPAQHVTSNLKRCTPGPAAVVLDTMDSQPILGMHMF